MHESPSFSSVEAGQGSPSQDSALVKIDSANKGRHEEAPQDRAEPSIKESGAAKSVESKRPDPGPHAEKDLRDGFLSAEELEGKDLYERLGLSPDADDRAIKSAYRRMVRKYHPDVNGAKGRDSEEQFKAIGEAYGVLNDRQRRYAYDRARSQEGRHQNQKSEPEGGHDDMREEDARERPRARKTPGRAPGGEDHRYRDAGQERKFYGYAHGPVYESTSYEEEDGFTNFFFNLMVATRGGKYFAVDKENQVVSRPYDFLFRLGKYRIAKEKDLVYLLNILAEEISAPYEKFRLEGDNIIGLDNGREYLLSPDTGKEISVGFDRIYADSERLMGILKNGQGEEERYRIDRTSGRATRLPHQKS